MFASDSDRRPRRPRRAAGGQTKSLIGSPRWGNPDKNVVKKIVQDVKGLAGESAQRIGDPEFLGMVEKAMEREVATVEKRRAAMAARRAGVGA